MKIAIIVIIFISGLIIIHLKQKNSDLEEEIQFLAKILFDNAMDKDHFYELQEDENGSFEDKSGKRFKMVKVDKKK